MGWWNQGSDGSSLHDEDTGLTWGDAPADALDNALDLIIGSFEEAFERRPSAAEIRAGMEFTLNGYDDANIIRLATAHTRPGLLNVGPLDAVELDAIDQLNEGAHTHECRGCSEGFTCMGELDVHGVCIVFDGYCDVCAAAESEGA